MPALRDALAMLLDDWNVIPVGSKEVELTTSENVNERTPEFRFNEY